MDLLNWILSAVSVLATSFAGLLFFRQQKRFKTAEAFQKEVDALKATIETIKKVYDEQIAAQGLRIDKLTKDVAEGDIRNTHLREANSILEIKHAKNKSAINTAYSCRHCAGDSANCPVLQQRARNEEEYAKSLEASHGRRS